MRCAVCKADDDPCNLNHVRSVGYRTLSRQLNLLEESDAFNRCDLAWQTDDLWIHLSCRVSVKNRFASFVTGKKKTVRVNYASPRLNSG